MIWSRRTLFAAGLSLAAPSAPAAGLSASRLSFSVFRGEVKVGEHVMEFTGGPSAPVVTTEVSLLVKLGPVPVYRYRHHAVERWVAGRFASLDTTTNSNGKREKVIARRSTEGLTLETLKGPVAIPPTAAPLTHWNPEAFGGPLFNPQEGKLLRVSATRKGASQIALADGRLVNAQLWSIRGETEIDDWYDAAGVWTGLKGKVQDGSFIAYRRL
ncbi:MAG: hypothetical protein CGW95_14425 [Phenylobacterium zucineum]|nr:MAG: hypothetical protein CGW95_14425 [Phenylobacterium zucineum]